MLRGAGILLIMLHNFTHWVPPVTGENEFYFELEHFTSVLEQLSDSPLDIWRILFSYFGHYGVQLFVFLSAFGLTRSLMSQHTSYGGFLMKRLSALYPAVIVAAFLFLIYNSIIAGPTVTFGENFIPLLRQLFLIGNFTGDGFTPIGPWWFLSMICQFYLIFPLLFSATRRFGSKFLLLLGIAAVVTEFTFNESLTSATGVNLNYTVIGHLAEFCLGIWSANSGKMRSPKFWIGLAGGVFILGQFHPLPWLLSGLAFILVAVPALGFVAGGTGRFTRFLAFFGSLSLPLFLINGFLRNPLVWLAQLQVQKGTPHAWLTNILWSLVFLLSCTVFALLAARMERALRHFSGKHLT